MDDSLIEPFGNRQQARRFACKIGETINNWLTAHDKSRGYLCVCLGVSKPFLNMVISGDKRLSIDRIKRLPLTLRIQVVEIVARDLEDQAKQIRALCDPQ